jgi:hypothetical protein
MKYYSLSLLILFTLSLTASCSEPGTKTNKDHLLDQYIGVWNGDSLDILDNIVSKNFQLRIVPTLEPVTGIENLKREISQTRIYFPDFLLRESEKLFVGDTAVVIRWTATGNFKNKDQMSSRSGKIDVPGFSIIFFDKERITGEWIAYSDLTWYEQLGFKLVPPDGSKK